MTSFLELFSGIGGFAQALPRGADVQAVDQSELARAAYAHNQGHSPQAWNLAGARALPQADFWWLSPPCQPYTRRGAQRDLEDPRSAALIQVCERISLQQPAWVGVENVPEFQGSQGHAMLLRALHGYQLWQGVLCPSQLGLPNRRRRFYLLASLRAQVCAPVMQRHPQPLRGFLDSQPAPSLSLSEHDCQRLKGVLPIIGPSGCTETFTSAYGRSLLKAGSLLRQQDGGVRRFSPQEILRLHGFSPQWRFPEHLDRGRRYRLVGNSLSVPVVRALLGGAQGLFVSA